MSIFEVESWYVGEGKDEVHKVAMRNWLQWVNDNKDLFQEWISVKYLVKTIAGEESGRHFLIWEYENLASFEGYKNRRKNYDGPYAEYKKIDPYHMGVFDHKDMKVEIWEGIDIDLWF